MATRPKALSLFGLVPRHIGGMEAFARELSWQLDECGWSSVLCYLKQPEAEARQFLEGPNVTFDELPDSFALRPRVLRDWLGILARHQPTVVHLHMTPLASWYPWIARFRGVEKIFLTDHFSHPPDWKGAKLPLWKRALIGGLNAPLAKVLCVSDYNRECFIHKGAIPTQKLERIYNGVDLSRVRGDAAKANEFRRRHGIPVERTVVMQVSWMIAQKGIGELIRAVRTAFDKNNSLHLVLVGDGAERASFAGLAESLGIGERVTFTGSVRDPLSEGAFAAADIVCQISQWQEAFGFTIAEAMASGKPVIASRVGGIPELIADGETGFLTGRDDIAAIADRILTLAADPGLRSSLGQYAQRVCAERFDVKKNVAAVVRLYGADSRAGDPAARDRTVEFDAEGDRPLVRDAAVRR